MDHTETLNGARPAEADERRLSVVFFVSGAAGLVFEVVWLHRCGLVFGNSVWATSIVLSSFMGGLALGSALVAHYGHRVGRVLRSYAILEAIVAVSGVALTYELRLLGVVIVPFTHLLSASWSTNLFRLCAVFALLVVPTTAMGATLPLLVGALSRGRPGFGTALGRLYGSNTLGAVVGVVGAEVVLIRRLGVTGSSWIAGLMDLGAAAAVLWMSRHAGERAPQSDESASEWTVRQTGRWRLLACAYLAGGNLMALEVVWFRFLSMFVVASTLTVSLMLAVVLAAMGIGGLVTSIWLARRPQAIAYLPTVALAAVCVSVGSYGAFQYVATGPWAAEWYRILWFACALTFPTSLLSAVLFTLIGEALKRHVGGGGAAAWLTLANTTGAMCGPLVAAFLLLPVLGMERAFFAEALVYGAIAVLTLREAQPGLRSGARRALLMAGPLAALALAAFPFGLMANRYFVRAARVYENESSHIVATREGPIETILLLQTSWMGRPVYQRLITNGFSMSGTHLAAKRYMRSFVYWPMLLHRSPLRRVLVVCYGVGVTVGAAVDLKSVESIDVVEISRDVVAMSDRIYPPGARPLSDPRVRLHIEDGRYFLHATHEQFDLITGEPPPPLTPGTVNLYTREYFQLIHDRLTDGGFTTYWLPVASRGEYDVKAIVRAFCDVFEDCSLWNGTPSDWMLMGTRRARGPVTAAQFAAPWSDPVLWPHLREIGLEVPQQIGAAFLEDAGGLGRLTAGVAPLTDDYPQRLRPRPDRLSLMSSPQEIDSGVRDLVRSVVDPVRARQAFERSEFIQRLWPAVLMAETMPFFDDQRLINRILTEGPNPLRHIADLHDLLVRTSLRRLPLWELGSDDVQQEIAQEVNDGSGTVEYVIGLRSLVAREWVAAARSFAESERRGHRSAALRPLRVYALCLAGDFDGARRLTREDLRPSDSDERYFWGWLNAHFDLQLTVH